MGVAGSRPGIGVLFAVGVFASLPAHGDVVEPVRFSYQAPDECPNEAAFLTEVRQRTERFRIDPGSDNIRTFRVRIETTQFGALGEVRVVDPKGLTTLRSIAGKSCNQLAPVLALVTALSIDPQASSAPPTSPDVTAASPTVSTEVGSPAPAESAAAPPTQTLGSVNNPIHFGPEPEPSRDASVSRPEAAPPHAEPWHLGWTFGAELAVLGLAAPGGVPGEQVFIDADLVRSSLFAPSLRASFAHATSATLEAPPGQARLGWTYGRLQACPIAVPLGRSAAIRPCADLDAGVVSATTNSLQHAQGPDRPWAALGGIARLSWTPFLPLVLELEGGVLAPLYRETFFVALPEANVYTAPRVAAVGGLAVGVRFP